MSFWPVRRFFKQFLSFSSIFIAFREILCWLCCSVAPLIWLLLNLVQFFFCFWIVFSYCYFFHAIMFLCSIIMLSYSMGAASIRHFLLKQKQQIFQIFDFAFWMLFRLPLFSIRWVIYRANATVIGIYRGIPWLNGILVPVVNFVLKNIVFHGKLLHFFSGFFLTTSLVGIQLLRRHAHLVSFTY